MTIAKAWIRLGKHTFQLVWEFSSKGLFVKSEQVVVSQDHRTTAKPNPRNCVNAVEDVVC